MTEARLTEPVLDITQFYLPIRIQEIFGTENRTALEIGFGEGDFLAEMAKRKPDWNFLGIEVKTRRFKKGVKKAKRKSLRNVKLLHMEAEIALDDVFSPNCFSEVYINFPDPWYKERHRKYRIINRQFLKKLSKVMKTEAAVEIASDHEEYVSHILETFGKMSIFESGLPPPGYVNEIRGRPMTKFESEYREKGREIYFLRFTSTFSKSEINNLCQQRDE